MRPCLSTFTLIGSSVEDAIRPALESLMQNGTTIEGRFHGSKEVAGSYKVVKVGRLEPSLALETIEFDRVTVYLLKDNWEFAAAFTRVAEMTAITLAFDTDRFLSDEGSGWVLSHMEALLSEFHLAAGVFDYDDDPKIRYCEMDKLVLHLTSPNYGGRRRPLIALIESDQLDDRVRNTIRQSGCGVARSTTGYDLFSWIDK